MKQTNLTKQTKKKGFSLLELLLVVGIAAILIVAGITTYNLVNKGNKINETVKLVNTVLDQARRTYSTAGNYTGITEISLTNSGGIPARYVAGAGIIATPFDNTAAAFAIAVGAPVTTFNVSLAVPPAFGPELAQSFNPSQDTNLVTVTVCGQAITAAAPVNPGALSAVCGAATAVPGVANFIINSR